MAIIELTVPFGYNIVVATGYMPPVPVDMSALFSTLSFSDFDASFGTFLSIDTRYDRGRNDIIRKTDPGLYFMYGGRGHDRYYVDSGFDIVFENAGSGTDTVYADTSFTLGDHIEHLVLVGDDDFGGTGNDLANSIIGNGGNNILYGAAGRDRLVGGAGDDCYMVDLMAYRKTAILEDSVTEKMNDGIDTLCVYYNGPAFEVAAHIALGAYIEHVDISSVMGYAVNITGNAADNHIIGNDGANIINGMGGADIMDGRGGDDIYVVDNLGGDVIIEQAGGGYDTVRLVVRNITADAIVIDMNTPNFTDIEEMRILGAGLFNIVAHDGGVKIVGNAWSNNMIGGNGNDMLDGGAGADIYFGGNGDDIYVIDNMNDSIMGEYDGGGHDTIWTYVSMIMPLQAGVEDVVLLGRAVYAFGNHADNAITGNRYNNILDGGVGADTYDGGLGHDIYVIDNAYDVILPDAGGIDTVRSAIDYSIAGRNDLDRIILTGDADINATGNDMGNIITGNNGHNILDGGAGIDALVGGLGADTYIVDLVLARGLAALQDRVYETGTDHDTLMLRGRIDTLRASNIAAPTGIETLDASQTGDTLLNLYGNTLNNVLIGNDAQNTLVGGRGADRFVFNQSSLCAVDIIADYRPADGDTLDLRDILSDGDTLAWRFDGRDAILGLDRGDDGVMDIVRLTHGSALGLDALMSGIIV